MFKLGKERVAHVNIGSRIPLVGFCRFKLCKRLVGDGEAHALLYEQQFCLQFREGNTRFVRMRAVIGESIS